VCPTVHLNFPVDPVAAIKYRPIQKDAGRNLS
jgi:hypothetical protein